MGSIPVRESLTPEDPLRESNPFRESLEAPFLERDMAGGQRHIVFEIRHRPDPRVDVSLWIETR